METPQNSIKKKIVLGVLFLLPIAIYMFFATGVNNFGKLPVLSQDVVSVSNFKDLNGTPVTLDNKITILGFFGDTPLQTKAYTYNLAHKIYKKNHEYKEFQFLILLPQSARNGAKILTNKISEIAPTTAWKYAFGTPQAIQEAFTSLNSGYTLDSSLASSFVFIIDKDAHLRGRNDDQDMPDGLVYGYNSADIGDINNRMSDDVKVVLAEYRKETKENSRRNQILVKQQ
ncbi:hypothetical protein N9572_06720 [Flavobacteriaceae bacterium]|nr:hypothetical protein [Flavobacteriaceae bacterium]MDB4115201.1 hypothetical protein [Flavobacteriaceae bacterium]MDC0097736.1 hypothetical protein [Flavobacteriaceae bacterium]MDC1199702.1 hypothetical protein [Flavobacteriaceae bacterium]MDC1372609.1 hypothetical protein [Flavobacteriaceae bacterium]